MKKTFVVTLLASVALLFGLSACTHEPKLYPQTPFFTPVMPLETPEYELPRGKDGYMTESPEITLQPLKPNNEPEEDDPRFDCQKHGNKQCGKVTQTEVPKKEDKRVACRGKAGTDEQDVNRNGWIDPNESAWRELCQ